MMDLLQQARASAFPAMLAYDDGDSRLTYGELGLQVVQEAAWLAKHAVARCALHADNGCAWAIADLALLDARLPNLPMPTFFTLAQIEHALDDAGVDHVLTDRAEEFLGDHPQFSRIGISPFSGLVLLHRPRSLAPRPLPEGVVKITYTSGSTGTPKGVCLTAATLHAVAESLATAVRDAGVQRHLCLLPLSTLLENLTALYVPLLLGATALLPPTTRTGMRYGRFDPQAMIGAIATSGAHSLVLVPELLRVLIAGAQSSGGFPALRFVAVGGAPVSPAVLDQAEAIGLPVFEGYGLSECASVVCLNTPAARRAGSVGRPLPHVRVRVDDSGEIHVAGAVMSGYLGDVCGGAGLQEIATGDIGEIDADGYVHVHGRRRNRFITSFGRNITPEWVENELQAEPELARVMVVGEAQPHVAALIWPSSCPSDDGSIARAVDRANARLPDYAQVRRWACASDSPGEFAQLLTANGRLRRDAVMHRHGPQLASLFAPR